MTPAFDYEQRQESYYFCHPQLFSGSNGLLMVYSFLKDRVCCSSASFFPVSCPDWMSWPSYAEAAAAVYCATAKHRNMSTTHSFLIRLCIIPSYLLFNSHQKVMRSLSNARNSPVTSSRRPA